jgi:hypothetical protein
VVALVRPHRLEASVSDGGGTSQEAASGWLHCYKLQGCKYRKKIDYDGYY